MFTVGAIREPQMELEGGISPRKYRHGKTEGAGSCKKDVYYITFLLIAFVVFTEMRRIEEPMTPSFDHT